MSQIDAAESFLNGNFNFLYNIEMGTNFRKFAVFFGLLAFGAFCSVLFTNCSSSKTAQVANSNNQQGSTKMTINTSGGWSDSPFVSRDGKRLYFMYSRYNFAPFLKSGGTVMPVLEGPDRVGLHHSDQAFAESDVYMATRNDDGSWSEPVNLGFNGPYGDACGMEINNGNTFVWLRGDGARNDIVISNKDSNGNWSVPQNFGALINDPTAIQDNPHLSPDGTQLWFSSTRTGTLGHKDIWFSQLSGGTWSNPINLGSQFNTVDEDDQFWVSPVDGRMVWNSAGSIKQGFSDGHGGLTNSSTWSFAGCDYAAEVSMPDDGQSVYFGCANLTTFRVQIMYAIKQSDGSWGPAIPVD